MTRALYNEIEPYAVRWLRNLSEAGHIAHGVVNAKSIKFLQASEVDGHTQFHAFAGIGVWSYALRLAGWPDSEPVWTGSCPCQPFSQSGRRKGVRDPRHLWPDWLRLIRLRRPPVVFGEQVASPDGLAWLDSVRSDLEAEGYAFGAADLCAAGVGAPHIRQRLFFMAYALEQRRQGLDAHVQPRRSRSTSAEAVGSRSNGSMADTDEQRRSERRRDASTWQPEATRSGEDGGLADGEGNGRDEGSPDGRRHQNRTGPQRWCAGLRLADDQPFGDLAHARCDERGSWWRRKTIQGRPEPRRQEEQSPGRGETGGMADAAGERLTGRSSTSGPASGTGTGFAVGRETCLVVYPDGSRGWGYTGPIPREKTRSDRERIEARCLADQLVAPSTTCVVVDASREPVARRTRSGKVSQAQATRKTRINRGHGTQRTGATRIVGHASCEGSQERSRSEDRCRAVWDEGSSSTASGPTRGFWTDAEWIPCRDETGIRFRPVEPGSFPLAPGSPTRVGKLRAYGNAIVPEVAAAFIQAAMIFLGVQPRYE